MPSEILNHRVVDEDDKNWAKIDADGNLHVVGKSIDAATDAANVIDYAHYDDGDGTLVDVAVARYGVFWVYKHIDDDHVYVRYGEGSYKLAEAEEAGEPTKPDHLTDFGLLIGKIIVPQAGGSFTTIQMVADTFFTGTAVSDHGELGGLDDDDDHTQYILHSLAAAANDFLVASGANTITTLAPDTAGYVLTDGGAGVAPSWVAPTVGTVTSVSGGTNISASGTAADPIMDLDAALITMDSVTFNTGGSLQTGTTATNSLLIQAYDVDGTAYVPFITLTAADDPTCDLASGVTIGTKYIYRADGTDVPVADGGTGAGTFTDHGVLIGNTTTAITATAEGATGTILTGVTGNEPAWTTATYPATAAIGTILVASGANTITTLAPDTAGYVLTDGGAGVAPSWVAPTTGTSQGRA